MALRTGFIGLGNIGKPLASHLAPAGFQTTIFDLDPAPLKELAEGGAKPAASPREVAQNADVIGICVPEDKHVYAVMEGDDGVLAGAARGTIVVVISTVQPETIVDLARRAAPAGVEVIDSCVTGGAHKAVAGTVTYMAGGTEAQIDRVRPFLECNSELIVHAGEAGNGARLKLAVNLLTYVNWAAAYEAFTLAKASGLPTEIFEQVVRQNGQLSDMQQQFLALHKLPEEARASDQFQAVNRNMMAIAEKDLAWALQLARQNGVTLPVAGHVAQSMARFYAVIDEGRR